MAAPNRLSRPTRGESLATRPVAVFLLLAGVAVLSYANTFHASFHLDDADVIVDNSQIKSLAAFRDLSGTRYVGFLTFALNYAVGGLQPVGYHVVNLLIHIINGGLVYTLVGLLFRTPAMSAGQGSDLAPRAGGIALATALLFVAHPLQTQAVTYIVQRFTSLAALFYLLAVVSYLQWRLADPATRFRYGWYAGAVAATLLAMKTKEHTFTLPVMLLLIEGVGFGLRPWRKWRPLLPFVLLLPLIPLSLPTGLGIGDGHGDWARETTEISRLSYFATQCRVLVTYLRLIVWPVGQNLDYDYPIYQSVLEPPVLASGLFLAGLLGLALYLLWKQPGSRLVGFGLVWFFLTVSVESSIIPIRDVIFEHRLYLPSVGVLLAGSVLGASLLVRWRVIPVIALVALVALLTGATYQRNRVWADDITLWRDVVAKSPKRGRGHDNLAFAYAERGQLEEALLAYQSAFQYGPVFPEMHFNRGLVYAKLGQGEAAIREYGRAIELKPAYAEAHYNLGVAYAAGGQGEAAIQAYRKAIELKPDLPEPHNNLGYAYLAQGRLEEASAEFQAAIQLRPAYLEAQYNLGIARSRQGRWAEAIQAFLASVRLKPELPEAEAKLGAAYAQQGRWAEAIGHYQRALQLRADWADVRFQLGQVYLRQGLVAEARREFEAVRRLRPDFEPAQQALQQLDGRR